MTYVLPIIEYCSEIFNPPPSSTLTKVLEQPLRLFTKLTARRLKIRFNSYSDRLKHFNMTSLMRRRINKDLVTTFKIIHNLADLPHHPFKLTRSNRHPYRLLRSRSTYKSPNWFFERVINNWNLISPNIPSNINLKYIVDLIENTPDSLLRLPVS